MHDKGIKVSMVNPKCILDFAKSLDKVHKIDKSDSKVMLSKRGNSKMWALLYMPKKYNSDIQVYYEWLLARGKTKM
ncbi:MAG: hypothetical protein Q4B82_00830 [Alysiella sp.]|uniref:hypothetical protein n=1 Tax=Alysiella sp. TaxID=1872483 RepID=UPI0026DD9E45|nr:hypothetical protein [Alysiella sp.]MDO4433112.1 hypothetical protein [Alysiella sp.]